MAGTKPDKHVFSTVCQMYLGPDEASPMCMRTKVALGDSTTKAGRLLVCPSCDAAIGAKKKWGKQ